MTYGVQFGQPAQPKPKGKTKFCLTHKELFHDIPGVMKGCYAGTEFKPCSGRYYEAHVVPADEVEKATDRGW